MKTSILKHLESLLERYPSLCPQKDNIIAAFKMLVECYQTGGQLLLAGNGGSAADAEHIAGELMKGFLLPRLISEKAREAFKQVDASMGDRLGASLQGALPAQPLVSSIALQSAFANDVDSTCGFAQQVYGIGRVGDVFWGISTSGNAENVLFAAVAAKAKGLQVLGLSGQNGGKLKDFSDVCICVPENEVYKIQELHLPVYHCLCAMLEEHFFGDGAST